jgi:hypothetical protein
MKARQMKNGELKIEKNVPLPKSSKGYGLTGLLRKMKSGESIFVPFDVSGDPRQIAYNALGKGKFSVHKEPGGARVWRK